MLSLRDKAAHVPVTLRASFADRTLAWVSHWGRKKLILAPFLFYPQRFFEVGHNPDPWSLWGGVQSYTPIQGSEVRPGVGAWFVEPVPLEERKSVGLISHPETQI